jgi:hypothetical protein
MLAQYIKDKGILEGGRVFLERLLTRRFGPLPDWGGINWWVQTAS